MKKEFVLQGSNGYDISCLEWKPQKENAVLVCLHGFAGDKYSSVISALAEELSQQAVRVISFDWPGHGKSPADGSELLVTNCMNDLESVIHYLDESEGPRYLFATSFGGFIGLNYVIRNPRVFAKIILRSPALNMPDTFRSFLTDKELLTLEQGGTVEKGFDRPLFLKKKFYDELIQYRLQEPELSIPGMMIQGDRDEVVDPNDSIAFARRNGWKLHIVRYADHRYKNPGNLEEIIN